MTATRQSRKDPGSLMSTCYSRKSRRNNCGYKISSSDLPFVITKLNMENPVNIVTHITPAQAGAIRAIFPARSGKNCQQS